VWLADRLTEQPQSDRRRCFGAGVSEGKSTVGVELMFEVNSGVIPRRSDSSASNV